MYVVVKFLKRLFRRKPKKFRFPNGIPRVATLPYPQTLTNKTLPPCECGHSIGAHECGLCQIVLNEGEYSATPIFCDCPFNYQDDDEV